MRRRKKQRRDGQSKRRQRRDARSKRRLKGLVWIPAGAGIGTGRGLRARVQMQRQERKERPAGVTRAEGIGGGAEDPVAGYLVGAGVMGENLEPGGLRHLIG